jgi:PAS domain S-box-containing protein
MGLDLLKKLFKEKFAIKVFVAFAILMFAISLSFTAFFINRQGNSMKDALIRNGRLLSKLLAHNSRIGVFSENKELLNDPIDGVIQQEDVLKVSLYNEKGELLLERAKPGINMPGKRQGEDASLNAEIFRIIKEKSLTYTSEYDEWLEFWSPVVSVSNYSTDSLFFNSDTSGKKEKIIGFARIAVDKRPLFKRLNTLLINSSVIGFILLIIGSVFVYLLIKSITGPLNRLTEGVKMLGRGEVVEKLPEETSDEIGKLAIAFNNMSASLRNRESALKESEEKYRQLFELESDAIFLIEDKTGAILEVNLTASRLYGYSRDELLGMNEADLLLAIPEDYTQTIGGHNSYIPVYHHRKKDGAVFPVETSVTHLSWQGNDVRISAVRDITERVRAEEEQAKLEGRLRQAQKMEAIGTLAGGIAHDFNNVLGIIVVNAELVMYDIPEENQAHENLEEILKACLRARDMVRQILAFSRKDEARTKLVMVVPLLKESVKQFRSTVPENIEILQDIHVENDIIMADTTQIHQILMNLYSNAAYALKKTGGIITVSLDNIDIVGEKKPELPLLSPGKYLKLSVRDTGEGIPHDILDRIFEPYFTTKKFGEGTGMGLAIAHGIIKSHGGIITVESEPGKGAVFNIYFPVIEADIRIEEEYEMFCPVGTERILFVDDEKPISDAMNLILSRLGYKVTSGTDSLAALKLFRENSGSFDLMITDLIMPNMTGVELSKEVSSIRPDMPIILCTGYSEMIDDEMISQAGIRYRTSKPLVMSEMANIIREALDRPQVRQSED